MNKFTKGCMITALVTFIIGALLFGVGALFGGLRQLEHINVRAMTGIPFRFVRNHSLFSFGFWDDWDDWEEHWDWDSEEWKDLEAIEDSEELEALEDLEDMEDLEDLKDLESLGKSGDNAEDPDDAGAAGSAAKGQATGLTADTLRKLELEVGACKMYIRETDDKDVSLSITGECENHYRYRVKDGNTLLLAHKDMAHGGSGHFWNQDHPKGNTKIYLYLPENMVLDEIDIDLGAGKLQAGYLRAREIEIEAGAGKCDFEGLEAAESVDISMGAGKITVDALTAKEVKLDMAAGDLKVNHAQISRKTEMNMSMGSADLQGMFAGEVDVECSMGNLTLNLEGAEKDYNYEIESGMGNVRIGGKSYNVIDEHEIYNGAGSTMEIACSMGTVDVNFTE